MTALLSTRAACAMAGCTERQLNNWFQLGAVHAKRATGGRWTTGNPLRWPLVQVRRAQILASIASTFDRRGFPLTAIAEQLDAHPEWQRLAATEWTLTIASPRCRATYTVKDLIAIAEQVPA